MESSEKIVHWSLKYSDLLKLKVEYYSLMKEYLPNIFDIGVFVTVHGKEYYGRGTDYSESIAYCKALSEAIERSVLSLFEFDNSNGLAVHPILGNAIENAKNEIIERDAFLVKFLLNSGMKKIEDDFLSINKKFSSDGIAISFYEMCKYENGVGILCVADGRRRKVPFGHITGTSFASNHEKALLHALVEVLRNLLSILKKENIPKISVADFSTLNDKDINFSHHGRLSLDTEYANYFQSLLDSYPIALEDNIIEEGFYHEILNLNSFSLPEFPLIAVRVNHPQLQSLYTGHIALDKINIERLKIIKDDINFSKVNKMPHPFD